MVKGRVDSRVRGQVIGVRTQMQSFDVFFGIILYFVIHTFRSVAANSGLRGRGWSRFKSGPFLYRKYKRGIKETNVSSSC